MSFQIIASGAGGFHYQNDNAVDLDDFNMVKFLNSVQFSKPEVSDAIQWAAEQASPSADMSDAVGAVAHIELLQLLIESVDMLATCGGADSGFISLLTIQKHVLWADDSRLEKFNFSGKSEPGLQFVRHIRKALTDTDLSTIGVIFQLAAATSKYHSKIGSDGTPKLWIRLSH
ncbi:hypothetical protein [Sphingomonas sp.]|uniref:hypothetical protein n=1 Tax=Sphingomonas sp. TaxID=28214 RepID=UPI003AFFEB3F